MGKVVSPVQKNGETGLMILLLDESKTINYKGLFLYSNYMPDNHKLMLQAILKNANSSSLFTRGGYKISIGFNTKT